MTEEYRVNEKFREYVDAYCRKFEIDKETALTHSIVKGVGNVYRDERIKQETKDAATWQQDDSQKAAGGKIWTGGCCET